MRNNLGRFIKGFNSSPNKNQRIQNECKICGKLCKAEPPSRIKAGRGIFCSKECLHKFQSTDEVRNKKISNSLIGIRCSPRTEFKKYNILTTRTKHRILAIQTLEAYYGMKWEELNIPEDAVIHHIDGNPNNSSFDNICVMTRSDHSKLHIEVKR